MSEDEYQTNEVVEGCWSESTTDVNELTGVPKVWCIRHFSPFYTTCPLCVQEETLETLKTLVEFLRPLAPPSEKLQPDLDLLIEPQISSV